MFANVWNKECAKQYYLFSVVCSADINYKIKIMNTNGLQKVEIDQKDKKLYIYYIQDNSHLMSNPPPPPSYLREVYSFDNMELLDTEYAEVKRSKEVIKWKS